MAETTQQQREHFVGVDFGGTKIYAGVFDARRSLIGSAKVSTKAARGPQAVLDRIARCVRDAIDECDLTVPRIRAVGVGAPGAVDAGSGLLLNAPNLGWKEVPLREELEKRLELPVAVENDGNAATIGVHTHELGGKPRHLLGIFIGTGIGGGMILNGELHTGLNKSAGEVGHMVLDAAGPKCSCGNQGCFEAMASRTAIFRRIQAGVKAGEKTALTDMLGPELKDLRSGDLRKAVRRGDKLVERIIGEVAECTGAAVGSLINLLNPEFVILGGGVIEALEPEMMPTIAKVARAHVLPGTAGGVEIRATTLGDHAGIIGAVVLAQRLDKARSRA